MVNVLVMFIGGEAVKPVTARDTVYVARLCMSLALIKISGVEPFICLKPAFGPSQESAQANVS
jgi:hypothetical protein